MSQSRMTTKEQRAVISLSCIMALRMLGLFMVIPVFSPYAQTLSGANPTLIGLCIGIYGLSQALFQVPFGCWSDRFGRKPIIIVGLTLFSIGSVIAGSASSIFLMLLGRLLQGVGAVGSTLMATIADLTRESQRTKAMAIAGITIGFSFTLAMMSGPILIHWMPVKNLFYLAAILGLMGIFLTYFVVPSTPLVLNQYQKKGFLKLLSQPNLLHLNLGIALLHAIFTASFFALPMTLQQNWRLDTHQQWQVYLPCLLIGIVISLICINLAERHHQVKRIFLSAIFILFISECLFSFTSDFFILPLLGLVFFFSSFSILESFLPSLVSRLAPHHRKGSALGLYSCAQFFGIFLGGIIGGWLSHISSYTTVYLFCALLALIWFVIAFSMSPPRHLITHLVPIVNIKPTTWEAIAADLSTISGINEVTLLIDEGIACLKMERSVLNDPDFIRLKNQLQSNPQSS